MEPRRSDGVLLRLHRIAMLVAFMVTAVWAMDHLTTGGEAASPPQPAAHTGDRAEYHPGEPRVFLLLVDSLRFETATDAERMPYLSAMRERGVHARVRSSRDAVTVSAIREMYTGRERFLALGFVKDFVTGRESVESIFTQLRAAGIKAAVYPTYAFEQFGEDLPVIELGEAGDRDQKRQNESVRNALSAFQSGEYDFVTAHIVYSDRVAHDHGVHGREYVATYLRIDALIRELDEAVAENATFVVAGDHGHTDYGRHSLGLDVPSFAVYRGPGFRAGTALGTIPIRDHRWLLSWALKIAPGSSHAGHPSALATERPPDAFASSRQPESEAVAERGPYRLVAAALGVLLALWLGLVGMVWPRPRRAEAGFWLTLLLLALMVYGTWLAAAALLAGAVSGGLACLAPGSKRGDVPRAQAWLAIAAAAGLAFHAWGVLLAEQRDWIHEPGWQQIERFAFAVILLTGVLAWRLGAVRAAWLALGFLGLLAYPTVYRYGAPAGLVTMWLAWMVAVLVDARLGAAGRGRVAPALALAIGIVFFLQPFAFASAGNFEHDSWHAWQWSLMPHGPDEWIAMTLVAKLVIFVRVRVPHWLKAAGVATALLIQSVHWGSWDMTPTKYVVAIIVLTAAGVWLPRVLEAEAAREIRRLCWLSALYFAYWYVIRIPEDHYMWADCFFAALVLSAELARYCAPRRQLAHHYAVLTLLALVIAGWVTVTWTLHLFEWKVLYDWFSAAFVEEHALAFIPFIDGKYIIPLIIARLLLRGVFGERQRYPRPLIWTAAGIKLGSVAAVVTGIGFAMADSDVYLEAIQEVAILAILAIGLA